LARKVLRKASPIANQIQSDDQKSKKWVGLSSEFLADEMHKLWMKYPAPDRIFVIKID